jgi:hypothetical protein
MSLLNQIELRLAYLASDAVKALQKFLDVSDLSYIFENVSQMKIGGYTGTGAIVTVATPFDPKFVALYDQTQQCLALHFQGMTADHAFKIDNAATGAIAADGITLGTDSFAIGDDADINTNHDVGFYLAIG